MRTRRSRSALERSDLSQAWEGFISRFNEVTTDSTEDIDITRRNCRPAPVRSSNHGLRNIVVAVVLMSAVLMFLNFALKVGNVTIGVLYPTWQTFKALEARKPESEDDEDDETYYPVELYRENWGSYWIVAGVIFSLEALFLRPTIGAFLPAPIYPALIFLSLVYLTKNNAESSRSLYVDLARPALVSMEGAVDKAAKTVMNRVEYYTGQILIHLHSVVEPYARQLNHAAAASRRQLREQEEQDEQPAARHRRGWR